MLFKGMKEGATEQIVEDLKEDPFVLETIKGMPPEVLEDLESADNSFLTGYLTGLSYHMNLTNRIMEAFSKNEVTKALQIKQMGNVILYILAQKIVDPKFSFKALQKEEPRLIVPE